MKTTNETETEADSERETIEVERDGSTPTSKALRLFGTGVFGGLLTTFGVAVVSPAFMCSHHCHGASVSQRERDAETRRRCMELGVTPDELAALDGRQ